VKDIFKTPKESAIETRYLVMPENTNHYKTVFGGVIMSWIDIAAAMVAEKHCRHEAVTVSIDSISFLAPAYIGDHIIIKASVNYVGNTSMEIGVVVFKENPLTGEILKTTSAYLTFVGLDKDKKPVKIPKILPQTDDEKRRYKDAELRMKSRIELHKKIKEKNM